MIRILPKDAPTYLASKWLHFDLLVETDEFRAFFDSIDEPFFLFSTMGVQLKDKNVLSVDSFLSSWQRYIDELKASKKPDDREYRFFFTALLTLEKSAVRALDLPRDKEMIVPYTPCVQMQMHRFIYSNIDQSFKTQSFGQTSVSWGMRLSYPLLYQHPETREVEKALDKTRFVNASLVTLIRSWLRKTTVATPFVIEGKRVNATSRLGKGCFSWINQHHDLLAKNLKVHMLEL